MTHPAISTDTSILEEMEFDIPCELIIWSGPRSARFETKKGCKGKSAKFIITYHSSKECKPISIAICNDCFVRIATESCVVCRATDRIISCTTIKK